MRENDQKISVLSIAMPEVQGSTTIPTAVSYGNGRNPDTFIGHEALQKCTGPQYLNVEFKLDLGTAAPLELSKQRQRVSEDDFRRSPIGIAQDFFHESLSNVDAWLEDKNRPSISHALIAEPVRLDILDRDVSMDAWLANYRRSIKNILGDKIESVSFLPEPFAVYLYYRYDFRSPTVAQNKKHAALVIDFGGGTFDVSVVETTKAGEISQSGTNQRPLGAKSISVGGFFINRVISEQLLLSLIQDKKIKSRTRKLLNQYKGQRRIDPDRLDEANSDHVVFLSNLRRMELEVEEAKIKLCDTMPGAWRFDEDLSSHQATVGVPDDPFKEDCNWAQIQVNGNLLRDIFDNQIWKSHLKNAISDCLERSKTELRGHPINVVLLSGGSANFRWLRKLIERDLFDAVGDAEIVELRANYQEIVAKGLAIECARRHVWTSNNLPEAEETSKPKQEATSAPVHKVQNQGNFASTTYNPVFLALRPKADDDFELCDFRGLEPEELRETKLDRGQLLPSGFSLAGRVDDLFNWRVRAKKAPSSSLGYRFLRTPGDPEDVANWYNIIENEIQVPKGITHGSSFHLGLQIRDDGTAVPIFSFGKGKEDTRRSSEGVPFVLDMTTFDEEEELEEENCARSSVNALRTVGSVDTFLGFDFGTSTTSFAVIDERDVELLQGDATDNSWLELEELTHKAPYPVALPLTGYLAATSLEEREKVARRVVEGALMLVATLSYAAATIRPGRASSVFFKSLSNRSAGPLWRIIKDCNQFKISNDIFAGYFQNLISGTSFELINQAVDQVSSDKHDTNSSGYDFSDAIRLLGNSLCNFLTDKKIGFFEGVQKKNFSKEYVGIFREISGPLTTFTSTYNYIGPEAFSSEEVYMCDTNEGWAISLSPLILMGLVQPGSPTDRPDLYMYDKDLKGGQAFRFRPIGSGECVEVDAEGAFSETWKHLSEMKQKDIPFEVLERLQLTEQKF